MKREDFGGGASAVVSFVCALTCALSAVAVPVTWEFPRTGSCHEGLPFADGVTGVLAWGGGDTLNLTVGRGDLWDHRGGYPWTEAQSYTNIVAAIGADDRKRLLGIFDKVTPRGEPRNPYMLPLGRVVVRVPGRTLGRGTLDPFTGLGEITFVEGGRVEIAMSKDRHAFALRFSPGVAFEARSVPATEHAVYARDLKPIGFERAVTFDGADRRSGGFSWRLPADRPVWLAWGAGNGEFVLRTGRGDAVERGKMPAFASVADDSARHWRVFWSEGARVKVPDPQIQRIFDYGMYKFGAMTDPDGVPAGLQGQWLEDDKLVPWNGDYHFNINVQECYAPAFRGGHFANLKPLFRMVLAWRPLLRANAKNFVGIDDGYVLPHSVDDRGVCIGGFWCGTIDHGSAAWTASLMFRYAKYARDAAFLRDGAYDFMKGAMNVYRAMMVERDGRLSLPLGPSPEWGNRDIIRSNVGSNPSFQLAAAHRLARDLVAAAKMLGEKPDPMWLDVDRRLPDYSVCVSKAKDEWGGGGGIALFEDQPLTASHRHHSHLAGFYPFDTIDMAKNADLVNATYRQWVWKGFGEWSGWSFPWASILHTHVGDTVAAVWMLKLWEAFYCNPGHGSRHDLYEPGMTVMRRGANATAFGVSGDVPGAEIMQMDGQCAAVTAILELMAHEVGGKVEFFRGCPAEWKDVSFENLALSDGRRVSGRRLDGRVTVTER